MKKIVGYFFKGLLIFIPFIIAFYFVGNMYVFFKNVLPGVPVSLVFLTALLFFVVIGFVFSHKGAQRINRIVKNRLRSFPTAHIIYTSIEKILNSPIKKKEILNKPVIFTQPDTGIRQIGFITNDSLEDVGLSEYVTVFLPKAFCIDGDTLIVPSKDITLLDMDGTQAYTLVISGGLTLPKSSE